MKKYKYLFVLFVFYLVGFPVSGTSFANIHANTEQFASSSHNSYNAGEQPQRGSRPSIDISKLGPDDYNPGVFRVKFSSNHSTYFSENSFSKNKSGFVTTGLEDFDRLSQQYQIYDGKLVAEKLVSRNEKSSSSFDERHKLWGFHLWYEFRTADKSDLIQIVDHFQSLESIEFAQPVFRIVNTSSEAFIDVSDESNLESFPTSKSQSATNDDRFDDQWGLYNYGQRGGIAGVDISMADAWRLERGKKEVVVAIIDGGVQVDHPDLAANIWRDSIGNAGYNFADNTRDILPNNHATHVAGIVSAASNNGLGVAGIAGGTGDISGASLMVCQVFSEDRCDGFHLAPIFAADNGAAISQNSWTYSAPNVYDHLALDAIDYFNTYGGGNVLEGGITIFAAGNKGSDDPFYPAYYEGTVAVASINNRDEKASTSNYGHWIDLSAPGVSILSTLANNSYGYSSGTSMAAPHVAGVAALIISGATTMLKASEVIDILLATTDDHYSRNASYTGQLGSGRLNAYEALLTVHPDDDQGDETDDGETDDPDDGQSDETGDGDTDDPDDGQSDETGDVDTEDPDDGQSDDPDDGQSDDPDDGSTDDPEEDDPDLPDDDDAGNNDTELVEYHFLGNGDWNDLNNWFTDEHGEIPAATLPISESSIVISARALSAEKIIIEGEGKVHIKAGGALVVDTLIITNSSTQPERLVVYPEGLLTVFHDLVNEGGEESILVVSNDSGSGSILHFSMEVPASFKYSNTNKVQDPWNTISIPLNRQSVDHQEINSTAYSWDEPSQEWIQLNNDIQSGDASTSQSPNDSFDAGIGYLLLSPTESGLNTAELAGILPAGEFSFELSRMGKSDGGFAGFNLIGNPYPSSVDWNEEAGWNGRSNLEGSEPSNGVSFWSWNPLTGNYGAYNNQSHADQGTNDVSRYIAPMQAFWVRAKNHGSSFSVNDHARKHLSEIDQTQKAGNPLTSLQIVVTNYANTYSDEVLIEFGHNQIGGSEKIFSMLQESPSLYTEFDEDMMSIIFLPQINQHPKIDLGFVAGVDAVHTIVVQGAKSFDNDVYLVDKQTGHRHNLSQRETYHFSASVYDDPERFEVQFEEDVATSVKNNDMEEPKIFYTSGQLSVHNPWNTAAEVYVFDAAGVCVEKFSAGAHAHYRNSFTEKAGVYVIRMTSQDKQFATRIVAI